MNMRNVLIVVALGCVLLAFAVPCALVSPRQDDPCLDEVSENVRQTYRMAEEAHQRGATEAEVQGILKKGAEERREIFRRHGREPK